MAFPDRMKINGEIIYKTQSSEDKKYNVPESMVYEKMIHELAKCYHQCKKYIEENYNEIDFWEMLCFDNLDNNRQIYESKKK